MDRLPFREQVKQPIIFNCILFPNRPKIAAQLHTTSTKHKIIAQTFGSSVLQGQKQAQLRRTCCNSPDTVRYKSIINPCVHRTIYNLKNSVHLKTGTSLSLTCKEVRLVCSEGLKRCFKGFFSPLLIASESNTYLESHLVLFLQYSHC